MEPAAAENMEAAPLAYGRDVARDVGTEHQKPLMPQGDQEHPNNDTACQEQLSSTSALGVREGGRQEREW